MGTRVEIGKLSVRKDLIIRSSLNEDAVQRYMDLYQSGKEKAIKVQAKTNIIIDGIHRYHAAKRLDLEKVLVDVVDVDDRALRALAYKYNRSHGVPLSKAERDKLIVKLYYQDGKTQQQIADLMGLTHQAISEIIGNAKICNADKRRKLTDEDWVTIAKLILASETQETIAESFHVAQSTISEGWSKFRDRVYKLYTEEKLLKKEVAEKVGLTTDEVDKILQEFGDPLNFEPMTTTWWPTFGLDHRFGKKHGSNLPAGLVRNILALYTKPGDTILDPAAGGGVVLDVVRDMVNRECFAYDLVPQREDIKTHNLRVEKHSEPENPDLIFLDLPYGPAKKGEYSEGHSSDLANRSLSEFYGDLTKIFGYWDSGTLVVLMSSLKEGGELIDLPYEAEKRMIEAGWRIVEHIVNEHGRIPSETGIWIEKARKERWLLRRHIHILVGVKP